MLTVASILGTLMLCSIPAFSMHRRRAAVRAAAAELRAIFNLTRSRAASRGMNAGVKFARAGNEWTYAIYDDGDFDGIRSDDIASGVDRRVRPAVVVLQTSRSAAGIALPGMAIVDPDGDRLLPTASPVQFGRSTICSFSPIGESTPGTIYLTDRDSDVYAVRVYGGSGKVRTLHYVPGLRRWEGR
jgi:hypothetical protein